MSTIGRSARLRTWWPVVAWAIVAYLVHAVGNDTGLYLRFGWYQNLTHALSASALAGLITVAGLERGYRRTRLVAFVVALSMAGWLGWETVEYFGLLDGFGVPLHFHDFNDAAVDMASNVVGAGATLMVAWMTTGLDTTPGSTTARVESPSPRVPSILGRLRDRVEYRYRR